MKPGDIWKSKLTDLSFTVDAVSKTQIEVSVQRYVKGNVEVRKKVLSPSEFSHFSSSYEPEKSKR